jgi:hypothetical protein
MIVQTKPSNIQRKCRWLLLVVFKATEDYPIKDDEDLKKEMRDRCTAILWNINKIFNKKMEFDKEKIVDLSLKQLNKLKVNLNKSYSTGLIENKWLIVLEKEIRELIEEFLSLNETIHKERMNDCHAFERKAREKYRAGTRDKIYRPNSRCTKHRYYFN